jgi:predicted RNA-binding Zn ribbon-like protein
MPNRDTLALKAALTTPVNSRIGGHLALDFCNTAGEHLAPQPDEMFLHWEVFVRWAVQVGLIGQQSYPDLVHHPSPIQKIIQLREVIYRIGLAVARNQRIPQSDLLVLRKQASSPKPPVDLNSGTLQWHPDPLRASAQLRSVLASEALSLFCSPRSNRIGICEGSLCGWLFLDESRGKRRRWCDMKDCGNREKARRYYVQRQSK